MKLAFGSCIYRQIEQSLGIWKCKLTYVTARYKSLWAPGGIELTSDFGGRGSVSAPGNRNGDQVGCFTRLVFGRTVLDKQQVR